jgi:hypothetical protein
MAGSRRVVLATAGRQGDERLVARVRAALMRMVWISYSRHNRRLGPDSAASGAAVGWWWGGRVPLRSMEDAGGPLASAVFRLMAQVQHMQLQPASAAPADDHITVAC